MKLRDDWIFGAFASYRHTFGRIKWTGQLNVNNVFDRVTARGTYRNARFSPDPRQYVLSNSFAF